MKLNEEKIVLMEKFALLLADGDKNTAGEILVNSMIRFIAGFTIDFEGFKVLWAQITEQTFIQLEKIIEEGKSKD